MNSPVYRAALGLLLAALSQSPASSAEDFVVMREITIVLPDEVVHSYRFLGPLKSARVTLRSNRDGVEALTTIFGNGEKVEIPANLLKCFKGSRATDSYLLLLPPDQKYPSKQDSWWAAVALPFGKAAGSRAASTFPYVQFVMTNWKLSGVVVQRSAEKSEKITLPFSECPAVDN